MFPNYEYIFESKMHSNKRTGMEKFQTNRFTVVDYCVFLLMIILSTGTGIYYGYFKRHKPDAEMPPRVDSNENEQTRKRSDFGSTAMHEYLLGSRKLKIFPVAMSLVASYISGVTMLGTPSEVYNYGTQYYLIVVAIIFMSITVATVYLPVFAKLRVGSSYEYLEMRFSSPIRSLASFMFVLDEIFFLPIIIYVPAIALGQVTGVNIHVVSVLICVCCVIYTLIGGIKAVVHTDAWQILVMFVALVIVVIFGMIVVGGPSQIFDTASKGERLIFFNFNPSLYERQTFWGVLIGGFTYWTAFNSVNQTMVQRYMSLPTLRKGQYSVIIFAFGNILFLSVCCFAGLLVYDYYANCDPRTAGLINHDDQLLPIYVMQTVGKYHGIPGVFIAGVFGAALSSLSVVLNCTALVVLQDIAKGCFKLKLSENAAIYLVKTTIVILGIVAVGLVYVVEKLSGILSVATSMTAIAASTQFGLFTLGMLVPWSNTKGALVGGIAGAVMTCWVSLGTQYASAIGAVESNRLPVSVSECLPNYTMPATDYSSDIFPLYRLSFHWVTPIGVSTTVIVGTIASFITGPTKVKTLDADLLSPVIHRYLPSECFSLASADLDTTRGNLLHEKTTEKGKF